MNNLPTIALFGEAEKGRYNTAYFCKELKDLSDNLGNPPEESFGLHYAVKALLFHYNLIFFRVEEEGFSHKDYLSGIRFLEKQELFSPVKALCVPGVGSLSLIEALEPYCKTHKSIMIITEPDLYDYLTDS